VNDLEIYVHAAMADIVGWLQARFATADCVRSARRAGHTTHQFVLRAPLSAPGGAAGGPPASWCALVVEEAAGAFTSICIEPAPGDRGPLPWPDDRACARDLVAHVDCEVRFCNGGWREDRPDDEAWVSLDRRGERLLAWPDA
jgi:hypothetical protein